MVAVVAAVQTVPVCSQSAKPPLLFRVTKEASHFSGLPFPALHQRGGCNERRSVRPASRSEHSDVKVLKVFSGAE